MILNLDTQFRPIPDLEEVQFEAFTFAGGEPHIKITTDLSKVAAVHVSQRLRSFNDIGLLLLAVDALRRCGVNTIKAIIPYVPAARQDRLMMAGEPLSIKVIADILNSCNFDSLQVFDVHSDVAPALLNNCDARTNHQFISEVVKVLPQRLLLVSPDGGALKKIGRLATELKNYEVLECSKSRDVKTGTLSGFKVPVEDLQGADCLLVDDICDGGGTFLGLAAELKKKNAGKLFLAVSHGIFSRGLDELKQSFDKIFTTDSFSSLESDEQLVQIKLRSGKTF
jgi:ribose-phosphate pyrophosphokinase